MQHLYSTLEGDSVSGACSYMSNLGKVTAYHRIKPHDPLLVRVPVYSFEF